MQVIAEALARFRLEVEPVEKFQLVQVALESGRGDDGGDDDGGDVGDDDGGDDDGDDHGDDHSDVLVMVAMVMMVVESTGSASLAEASPDLFLSGILPPSLLVSTNVY